MISEYAVCVVLISVVAALLFAACAMFLLLQEGSVAAGRIIGHIAQQWHQPAPLPAGKAMKQEG